MGFKLSDKVIIQAEDNFSSIATTLGECIIIINEIETLQKEAKDLGITWKGATKDTYLALEEFMGFYVRDLVPAIEEYKTGMEAVSKKINKVKEGNNDAIKKFNEIPNP